VVNARFYETQRAAEHALRLSEERLRLATDAGGLGIWDWNIQSDQVTWSHRVYELHRLEPGSFGGRAQDFAALVHPDDLPHVQERIAGALASGGSYRAEFRTVLPGGEIRWLATKANVYLDERGNAARMVGATFDVTERIALLAAERAARAQAESASRAKDEFLAMLGHELRNPLAPIVSALQLMEMRSEGSKRYEHGVIERQVKHLSRLVDDLLDISRITQGKVKLALEQIDILPVIERAIELAAPAMRKKSLDFVAHLPEQPVIVSGDAVRLAQVFGNLLSNAAKFTQQGLIELRATCSGGRLTVDLTDSGTGIPAALLPHVFDMFVQGSQHIDRKMGGLGLGLSIAKTLVDMHGGELRVHSDGPDCGSTFTVELPCIMESSGVPHHEKTAELPRSSARVMIVDDNADAGETMAELLKMAGCEVCCLTSALQAIGTADTFKPAVAVLDIGLPEMDGYELARRLKARLPGIRLIALTGYGREPDKARALAADFDRHLVKPAAVGDLLSAIRELTLTGAV
jgi:signal transduction histidine kinase/ActR/RegA family two-component response regulator